MNELILPLAIASDVVGILKASGLSLWWALLGNLILIGGYKLFDWMLPDIKFCDVLKQNPIALALVIASYMLGMSAIVVMAIS